MEGAMIISLYSIYVDKNEHEHHKIAMVTIYNHYGLLDMHYLMDSFCPLG